MSVAFAILVIVFILAMFVWASASRRITQSGVPEGRVVYQDADRRRALLNRPLVSARYGLTGKPDYLIETSSGLVPVELKSRDCPKSGPCGSDTAQLTAYCILVEDTCGATPP
jgi:CRISPR-associated exonuclease Cas4